VTIFQPGSPQRVFLLRYDFARLSWDDTTQTMTGRPLKCTWTQAFDNDKFLRASMWPTT